MIEITPIQLKYVAEAKLVISAVARNIFEPDQSLEEFIEMITIDGELNDIDHYDEVYTKNRGVLLVALDDGKVIGTAGIRRLHYDVAELKRIWLLEEYHGQKIGYQMVSRLLEFAKAQGYFFAYLETTRHNKRAVGFYKKIGFYEIPSPYDDDIEVSMEMQL